MLAPPLIIARFVDGPFYLIWLINCPVTMKISSLDSCPSLAQPQFPLWVHVGGASMLIQVPTRQGCVDSHLVARASGEPWAMMTRWRDIALDLDLARQLPVVLLGEMARQFGRAAGG